MVTITRKDLLTPYENFEKNNRIKNTRDDIPRRFLGICPSKYYKVVEMNTAKLAHIVDKLFKKVYRTKL